MQKDLEVTMSQVQRRSVARSVIELWEVLAKGIGSAWHAGKLRPLGISRWSAGSQGNVYEVKCLGREFLISMQIVQSSAEKLYAAVRVSETKSEAVGREATPLSITAFIQDDGGLIGEDGTVITAALSQNPMTAAEIFCRLISDRVISTIPQGGPRFNPG